MRFETNLQRAEKHRLAAAMAVEPINAALRNLLADDSVSVEHQHSDGWVVLFGGENLAAVAQIDFDELMALDADDAVEYLMSRVI